MPRELIQARADPDTVERIEEYAEERDISRSEAIRRLLRDGLEADEDDDETEEYAVAKMNPTVRVVVGALMGLALLFLLLSELGVL